MGRWNGLYGFRDQSAMESGSAGFCKAVFLHTQFNEYIGYFFGPPFMVLRSLLPQLLAVILGWD